ncbi:uncharacterized protein PgNI_02474, partial [Pyricularia grisea]|uniref:Uncharacterized protein n=1 Tax=Pyricularia grisea TaxID=148305 RepID=A0A6P8BHQ0_PYRGI
TVVHFNHLKAGYTGQRLLHPRAETRSLSRQSKCRRRLLLRGCTFPLGQFAHPPFPLIRPSPSPSHTVTVNLVPSHLLHRHLGY